MSVKYKADSISVTTEVTEIDPVFDVGALSVLPTDGDILFRIYDTEGWGDWITVPKNIPFDAKLECSKFQIKSATGTVAVNYFTQSV